MINKALHQYLRMNYGEEVWKEIAEAAGIHHTGFISLEIYPDEITHALVLEASRKIEHTPDSILEELGEYWIAHIDYEGYGDFFFSYGDNIIEFLNYLNAIHVRIMLLHPKMRIPKFELKKQSKGVFDLHYFSERKGLAPMVKGLLRGLSKKFSQPISIAHIHSLLINDAVHEIFRVELLAN